MIVNRGGFTIETGTGSLSAIEVANDGTYLIEFNVHVVDDAAGWAGLRYRRTSRSCVTDGRRTTARTSMYWRGPDDTDCRSTSRVRMTVDLSVGVTSDRGALLDRCGGNAGLAYRWR